MPIDNDEIKEWLEEIKVDLTEFDCQYSLRSSGNIIVIGFNHDQEYRFIVANGYSELVVDSKDIINYKFN